MKYLLFGALIAALITMYVYYEHKLATVKKQLMITSKQFNHMREQYRKTNLSNNNLNVMFSTPTLKTAITNDNATVYLAPLLESPKLRKINNKITVTILDTATINNSTWFYVNTHLNTQYNCRGWIAKNDFSVLCSNSQDISPL